VIVFIDCHFSSGLARTSKIRYDIVRFSWLLQTLTIDCRDEAIKILDEFIKQGGLEEISGYAICRRPTPILWIV
jgi:hypothetical protein